jgi:mRNA-degrading endonuclease RelE of RelBE toxin-antitoxin system
MEYDFCIHERASRALASEPVEVSERIRAKITEISTNEYRDNTDYDVRVIQGCEHDIYGLRIGSHRVAFVMQDDTIALLAVTDKGSGTYRNTATLDERADEFC